MENKLTDKSGVLLLRKRMGNRLRKFGLLFPALFLCYFQAQAWDGSIITNDANNIANTAYDSTDGSISFRILMSNDYKGGKNEYVDNMDVYLDAVKLASLSLPEVYTKNDGGLKNIYVNSGFERLYAQAYNTYSKAETELKKNYTTLTWIKVGTPKYFTVESEKQSTTGYGLHWINLKYYFTLDFESSTENKELIAELKEINAKSEGNSANNTISNKEKRISIPRPFSIRTMTIDINNEGKYVFNATTSEDVKGPALYDATGAQVNEFLLGKSFSYSFDVTDAYCLSGGKFKFRARKNYDKAIQNVYKEIDIPQIEVFSGGLTVEPNTTSGKIDLKWTTKVPTASNYLKKNFLVQKRIDNSSWTTFATVGWSSNGLYTATYDIPEGERQQGTKTYQFRVIREGMESVSASSKLFYISDSKDVNTNYSKPNNLKFDSSSKRVYFKVTPGLEPSGFSYEVETKLKSGSFGPAAGAINAVNSQVAQEFQGYTYWFLSNVDDCIPTTYIVNARLNATIIFSDSLNVLYNPNVGTEISSFKASKGYFNDRIELKWEIPSDANGFSGFKVVRSLINDATGQSKTIVYEEKYNDPQKTSVSYTDNGISPGIFYKYDLYGVVSCDTETDETLEKTDYAYAQAFGQVNGKLTFTGTTTGVPNVDIIFENTSSTDITGINRALDMGSRGFFSAPASYGNQAAMTFQLWVKLNNTKQQGAVHTILNAVEQNNNDNTETSALKIWIDDAGLLNVELFNQTVTYDSVFPVGNYFHLTQTIVQYQNICQLKAYMNGILIGSKTIDSMKAPVFNHIYVGDSAEVRHLDGMIDELRVWNRILTDTEILGDYNRYIPANNNDLKAYYRFDEPEGILDNCYDLSGNDTKDYFNENHGLSLNDAIRTTTGVPAPENLALKARTDASGNYASGLILPYRTIGSSYKITPILGVHQFDPSDRSLTISSSTNTINNIDFSDISKFTYNGRVVYEGGNYPVEGCSFYIDNVQQTGSDYQAILSDAEGNFSLSVPVGTHTIKVFKQGHTFVKDTIIRNFQDEELAYNVRFEDNTRTRVVGRVVGGTAEDVKPLGFGESKNNIGPARIVLQADKEAYSFISSSTNKEIQVTHFDTLRSSKVNYKGSEITIRTDETTGEFFADVYPENFRIMYIYTDTLTSQKDLLDGVSQQWDLRDNVTALAELQNYLTRTRTDEGRTYTDSIAFNDTLSFQYRVSPTMIIKELDEKANPKLLGTGEGVPYYGEPEFVYQKSSGSATVPLVSLSQDGKKAEYAFVDAGNQDGYPVYSQNKQYTYQIALTENYTNWKTGVTEAVPVANEEIRVINEMAQQTNEEKLQLDSLGQCLYESIVYKPNTATGLSSIEFSYPCISSECPYQKIEAIVIGGESTGTNFTTQGPDKVFFVLRDPPGNNSYAYLETETSMEYTKSYTIEQDFNAGAMAMVKLGTNQHVISLTGMGVSIGTMMDLDLTNDLGVGLYATEAYNEEGSKVTTITTKQRIETSSDEEYVGPDADVFVGASTNILYGYNNMMQIGDKEASGDFTNTLFNTRDNLYFVGKNTGIAMGESFKTTFHYTQRMIRDILIPEWRTLIGGLLKTASPPAASTLTSPYYYSHYATNHENFGKQNSNGYSEGDSYTIVYPAAWTADDILAYTDSVRLFNQQITGWERTLMLNERAKVRALQRDNFNYSFGDGVNIDYSVVKDTVSTNMTSLGGGFVQKFEGNAGFQINKTGIQLSVTEELNFLKMDTEGSSSRNSETTGFVLSTSSSDNKLTVDIYEGVALEKICLNPIPPAVVQICYWANTDSIAGGFIFITRGGQTSCPHEDEYVTEYYNPGTPLNTATMRNEVPLMRVLSQSTVTGVPADGKAVYRIQLINNSESRVDRWYQLRVESSSNPDGAVVSLDGKILTEEGTPVFVPYGETGVIKTLTIERGPQKYTYDNINLVMASECQYNNMNYVEDIFSAATLSAGFLQGCSEITMSEPLDYWVMNTENQTSDALSIKVTGFDRNFENLGWVDVQWKDSYASVWNTLKRYYFSQTVMNGDNTISAENKALYDGSGQISCPWDMSVRSDGNYDVRALTACIDPNTYLPFIYTTTPAKTGVKDMLRPEPFGRPEPKDGVLDIDDEIMIQFNEPISSGRIIADNIQVTGIRSEGQGPKYHPAAVHFDGAASVCSTQSDITLATPFTVEAWIRPNGKYDDGKERVIFSHGDNFRIGIVNDVMYVKANNKTVYSPYLDYSESEPEWCHFAIVYETNGRLNGYFAYGSTTAEFNEMMGTYKHTARVAIGNSVNGSEGINADIHDLRIWTKSRSETDIAGNLTSVYNGVETDLKHYWRFDEMEGTAASDRAGGLTASLDGAIWTMPDPGKSLTLPSGSNLNFPGTYAGFANTSDFTVEMWFKGASQTGATLFSAGNGAANSDLGGSGVLYDSSDKLSIFFNTTGKLSLSSNSRTHTINSLDYLDSKWHHLAFTVNRLSNATLYIDGNAVWNTPASNIGGMVADKYYIGQRGWYPGNAQMTENLQLDNPFQGQIDDVRIWNAALDAAHIKDKKNVRLSGTEIGLVSYYPFESYGVEDGSPVINTSLVNFAPDKTETATLVTGATLADDYAPVKMEGPVENLGYRKVVNGDKILITLTESRYRVEKSLVTISVDGIQDLNGNKQASAIIWTAYINQSQLRWAQSELALEGKPAATIQQGVQINNTSGESKNFTITDIPTWLEVTPSSGTIAAQSSQNITVKTASAVNTGNYEQTLLLNGPTTAGEPESIDQLTIKLNMKGEGPDWTVNPADYEFSSGVIASLLIDNVYSTDINDRLAAFVGDECRGVANVTYESAYGRYVVYLTVYSDNFLADNFIFRIWDASASEIREATTTAALDWDNNYSYGSVNAPVVFTATDAKLREIDLPAGWNWLSFNTKTSDMSVNKLFGELTSKADVLKSQTTFSAATTGQWKGSLENVDNKQMYKLKMNQPSVLHTAGTAVTPGQEIITLLPNWNWIGYTPQGALTLQQALAGLQATEGDIVKDQTSFSTYSSGNWVGSLGKMLPGKGYVYQSRATENKSFTYPYVASATASELRESSATNSYFEPVSFNAYSDNMSIIAVVKRDGAIVRNIELGAFVDEECRGAQTDGENGLIFISVAGEGNASLRFRIYDQATGEVFKAPESLSYSNDAVIGTLASPYVIQLYGTGIAEVTADAVTIYPNPVKNDLNISHPWKQVDKVEIINPEGRVLSSETDFIRSSLNVSNLSEGMYFLRITQNGQTVMLKFIKM